MSGRCSEDTPTSVQVGQIDEPISKVVVKPVNSDDKIEPGEVIAVLVVSCIGSRINVIFPFVVSLVGNTYVLPTAVAGLKFVNMNAIVHMITTQVDK